MFSKIDKSLPFYHATTLEEKITNLEEGIEIIQHHRQLPDIISRKLTNSLQLEMGTRIQLVKKLMAKQEYQKAEEHIYVVQTLTQNVPNSQEISQRCEELLNIINRLKDQALNQ